MKTNELKINFFLFPNLSKNRPTKKIPKKFTWGSGAPEQMDSTGSLADNGSTSSLSQDVKRTGQILWIRGLTRLQTQVMCSNKKLDHN